MMLTVAHARARTEVVLPDGRPAWLTYLPAPSKQRSVGGKARVVLENGRYLSVDPHDLTIASLTPPTLGGNG